MPLLPPLAFCESKRLADVDEFGFGESSRIELVHDISETRFTNNPPGIYIPV
jgi:hypothetical protein